LDILATGGAVDGLICHCEVYLSHGFMKRQTYRYWSESRLTFRPYDEYAFLLDLRVSMETYRYYFL